MFYTGIIFTRKFVLSVFFFSFQWLGEIANFLIKLKQQILSFKVRAIYLAALFYIGESSKLFRVMQMAERYNFMT